MLSRRRPRRLSPGVMDVGPSRWPTPATIRQNLTESPSASRLFASSVHRALLGIGDDVRICFFHPFDLMNLCDDHIGESSFVSNVDEQDDIRSSKTRVSLFDT